MSEDESIELKNLGNKSFKKKRKNRIKKKTFSHVEKVLFRKKKKNRLIYEGADKKVNETEVGFVSSIFLRCK